MKKIRKICKKEDVKIEKKEDQKVIKEDAKI